MVVGTKLFRPLLAATIDNDAQLDALSYPMIASPKVDGIRIICHPSLGPVTRSLKPLRNAHIRGVLSKPVYQGFDGEVVSGDIAATDVFNRTTTAVMTQTGIPEFMYHVFDNMEVPFDYNDRLTYLQGRIADRDLTPFARLLLHRIVRNPQDVLDAEIDWLALGFEGIMLRNPKGPYKHGRSTLLEQTLLKLKRFTDAEACITGFEPLFHNTNTQTRNSQGLAERSDHKAGKVQAESLGNLIVRDLSGQYGEFNVGSGFDQSLRQLIWDNRDRYLGKTITYKYQKIGSLEAPRFPIFLRFREAE